MQEQAVSAPVLPKTCRAWVYRHYFEDKPGEAYPLEKSNSFFVPALGKDHILVRVHACTVNPIDWKVIAGPFRYLPTFIGAPPFDGTAGTVPCADGSGVVVQSTSAQFAVGDEVVFDNAPRFGALAEYVAVPARQAARKPANVSFVEATAHAGLASGTAVLGCEYIFANHPQQPLDGKSLTVVVLGGAGGVGSSAICYLKAKGHTVYTTCSGRNVEWCRRLGADAVIDYTQNKWRDCLPGPIDAVYQCVGTPDDYGWAESVLKKDCVFVSCNGQHGGMIGSFFAVVGSKLTSPLHYYLFINKPSTLNLSRTVELVEQDKLLSLVGQVFSFDEADKAFDLSRSNKATGKIVIQIV